MIIGETPLPSGALGVDAVAMTMRFGDFLALDRKLPARRVTRLLA